jgi:hypothetical protein
MKIVLACLMCVVLTASECFAISGGPVFGGSQVSVTGTYAGVFVPVPQVLDPGPPPVTFTDMSFALFTLNVPKVGLATGTVAIFRNGNAYTGDIQASADPDSAVVSGVISAIRTQAVPGTDTTLVSLDFANGILKAKAAAIGNLSSSTSVRLRGKKSSITYTTTSSDSSGDSGGPIFYKIRGFKQSEATG